MDVVNKPIKIDELQVGDEVIVRGQDLNYMKIIRPPKEVTKTYTINGNTNTYKQWNHSKCLRMNGSVFSNNSKWDKEVYFDFYYKSIWLVKRVEINK
jgi:hypothetical protein